jgi:hypothetical protein
MSRWGFFICLLIISDGVDNVKGREDSDVCPPGAYLTLTAGTGHPTRYKW